MRDRQIIHECIKLMESEEHTLKLLLLVRQLQDINASDGLGQTILQCAIEEGRKDIVKALLEMGTDPNNDRSHHYDPPLCYASKKGSLEDVQILLEYGANPNVCGSINMTPLMYAIQNKHINIVLKLLEHGADIDVQDSLGRTPLMLSLQEENMPIFALLMQHKPNIALINNQGETASDIAIKRSLVHAAEILKHTCTHSGW